MSQLPVRFRSRRFVEAMLDQLRDSPLTYKVETVVETLREGTPDDEVLHLNHIMADLIESQGDQIKALQVRLASEKVKTAKLTTALRKSRRN